MKAADFFYYSLGIGIWIFIAFLILAAVEMRRLLKKIETGAERFAGVLLTWEGWKSGLKWGLGSLMTKILPKKGGE